ncbi:hypothetical protein JCM10449v2_004736 [Rhodotorula kratochvilovae]
MPIPPKDEYFSRTGTPTGQLPSYDERMARRQHSQQSLRSAPSTLPPRAQSTARTARPVSHAPRDAQVMRMYRPEDFVGEIPVMLDQDPKDWDRTARARREPPVRQGRS